MLSSYNLEASLIYGNLNLADTSQKNQDQINLRQKWETIEQNLQKAIVTSARTF